MISLYQHYNVEGRSSCGIKLVNAIEIKAGMKALCQCLHLQNESSLIVIVGNFIRRWGAYEIK